MQLAASMEKLRLDSLNQVSFLGNKYYTSTFIDDFRRIEEQETNNLVSLSNFSSSNMEYELNYPSNMLLSQMTIDEVGYEEAIFNQIYNSDLPL